MKQENQGRMKLSVLAVALSGALAAMAAAHAQTTISTNQTGPVSWSSSDLAISNGITISGGPTGVAASGSPGTLTNAGTITAGTNGVYNTGVIGSISNSGVISGGTGIVNDNGTITSLSNDATISGSQRAIYNSGRIDTLTNTGSIIGGAQAGIVNISSGTIQSLNNSTGGAIDRLNNAGAIGTLTNTGTINSSAGDAIANTGSIQSLNNTGSIISTVGHGVGNSGSITALVNSGYIAGPGTGLNNTGSIGSLTNIGTISGGIYNGTTISALINSGLISSSGSALIYDVHSSVGSLANTGTIAGGINNATAQALTITGGSGATFGTLTGFGGSIGTIHNNSSNIVFASGNQYLNDNIDVTGHTATNSGAVLQVNNPIAITGSYTQNAGGTLNIGVADGAHAGGVVSTDSGYGRLVVSGVATFDAGSSIALKKLNAYAFAQGQRFVVVQADNANANYHAGALNYSADGFTGSVVGSSVIDTNNTSKTDLMITLTGGGSTAPVNNATDGNASAALGGLFHYTGNDAGLLSVFNPAAALGTSGAANKAGAQLSPAATGSAAVQAAQSATQSVTDVANAHIDTLRVAQASGSGSSGIATGERPSDVAVWGQAFYGQSNQSDRAGAAGYKAGYNGTLIGVDTAVGDQWRVGGLVNYANISIANTGDNTGSSGHVTSYGVLGYAGYAAETWYLNLSAGVAAQKYNTLRAVNFAGFAGGASGSFDGTDYSASAQAGYPIKLDAATTLTPIGRLMYQRLHQDGYTETGSAAALQIGSASTTSIKSDLGAKLERVFKTSYGDVTPSAQLSWRHEYRDTALRSVASFAADTTGTTGFVSQSAAPEKDTGVLVLGVTLARTQNLTLSGHYTLEAAGGYTAQTADVRLRYQF